VRLIREGREKRGGTTKEYVRQLTEAGYKPSEIARRLGISDRQVRRLQKEIEDDG